MAQDIHIPEGHITLKEAAQMTGYSPDYVGQLIRKGKLYGRQVYFNVAWVTTEEALKEYMEKERSGSRGEEGVSEKVQQIQNLLMSEARLSGIVRGILYGLLFVCAVLAFILFYVFSVNIDRALTERAEERVLHENAP